MSIVTEFVVYFTLFIEIGPCDLPKRLEWPTQAENIHLKGRPKGHLWPSNIFYLYIDYVL